MEVFILLNLILNIGQALMRNQIEFIPLLLNSMHKLNPGENQYSGIVEKVKRICCILFMINYDTKQVCESR